jgi:hypothetical protein
MSNRTFVLTISLPISLIGALALLFVVLAL